MSSGHTKIPAQGLETKKATNKRFRKVDGPKREVIVERPSVKDRAVLNYQKYRLIFSFLLLLTKRDKNMLTWIKERLQEPSSYQGLIGLLAAVGYTVNPDMLELIATTAVGLISLIQLGKNEKFVEKTDAK